MGVGEETRDVESFVVEKATLQIGHGNDLCSLLVQQAGQVPADITEPLNRHTPAVDRDTKVLPIRLHHVHEPTARCLVPSERAAQGHWLAGNSRRCIAPPLRVLVHHPCHHLSVRSHVRGGDVAIWTQDDGNAVDEGTRDSLVLAERQVAWVHFHTALGPTERDVQERGLPRHGCREAEYLVLVGVRMVAHASLARPPRPIVLDAVAAEHLDVAVVHLRWHLDRQRTERHREDAPDVLLETDQIGRELELIRDNGAGAHRRTFAGWWIHAASS